jgi:hypothetical protein
MARVSWGRCRKSVWNVCLTHIHLLRMLHQVHGAGGFRSARHSYAPNAIILVQVRLCVYVCMYVCMVCSYLSMYMHVRIHTHEKLCCAGPSEAVMLETCHVDVHVSF